MKIKILLIITAILFLTGCASNDNTNSLILSPSALAGDWNLTSQTVEDGTFTATENGVTITATYTSFARDINVLFSFTENPNEVTQDGTYTLVNTISLLGQEEVEEEDVILSNSEVSNWSLENNILTITDNDVDILLSVEEFTDTYIKLKSEIDETETFNGETVSTSATLYIVLER